MYCFVSLAEVTLEQHLDYTSKWKGNTRTGQQCRDPHMRVNEER